MRFYVSPESIFPEKNLIEIKDKKELHHIRDVMRLRKGECVDIFDGKGREYTGEIKDSKRDLVVIEIRDEIAFRKDLPCKITLYQAIPKRKKMDFIVEKSVELGAWEIVPIVTERTEGMIGKQKAHIKKERWIRIAKAASKQCGRAGLPLISDPINFNDALIKSKQNDLVVFAALDKSARPLREILKARKVKSIAVFIGPEGDFSQKEISMAKGHEYKICSLGSLVLRAETASMYILSCLNYEYSIQDV
ncbi:RsmE family RNA methyltransferase [Candidatus Omnitrophota bacterium]